MERVPASPGPSGHEKGVKLVISEAHEGLKRAIAEILAGASWQRRWVRFVRNLLADVPKKAQAMVAALIRTIFAQPDGALAREQLEKVADSLARRFPKVATHLREAADDVLTYMAFPPGTLAADLLDQPS